MIDYTERFLKERNQRILIIDTSSLDSYEGTRQFYLKNQYELEARIRDFWNEGEDKIIFRKAL